MQRTISRLSLFRRILTNSDRRPSSIEICSSNVADGLKNELIQFDQLIVRLVFYSGISDSSQLSRCWFVGGTSVTIISILNGTIRGCESLPMFLTFLDLFLQWLKQKMKLFSLSVCRLKLTATDLPRQWRFHSEIFFSIRSCWWYLKIELLEKRMTQKFFSWWSFLRRFKTPTIKRLIHLHLLVHLTLKENLWLNLITPRESQELVFHCLVLEAMHLDSQLKFNDKKNYIQALLTFW